MAVFTLARVGTIALNRQTRNARKMLIAMTKATVPFLVLAVVASAAREVRAEIPLAKTHGWELSLDGRLNTFVSFAQGDGLPVSTTYEGIYDYSDANGNITKTRVRSGFIQNVLGLTLKKALTADTTVTGRFGTWVGVSQADSKNDIPSLDMRELYIKVDGPWGGLLAGRNLSLFGRGAILLDYEIHHEYGLGSPCSIQTVQGGACGFSGYGILFPAYNAAVVYNTPDLVGFQLSVGAYDPSAVSTASYQRTPYPRMEGEASFKIPNYFKASISGQWQRIGQNAKPFLDVDASGASFSVGATLGPVQLGAAGFIGQGLGIYSAMEDSPIFSDTAGALRHQQGVIGLASITLGDTKIAGGAGAMQIKKTLADGAGPLTAATTEFPQQQLGISVGIYQHVKDILVLALEYFRASITWQTEQDPANPTGPTITPKQNMNFVNAGLTLIF
jgi:Gram-negative porin